ncbi:RHS repeat-associated core domain-containing protein [Paenibacillus chitinolyticus]|uniref:RHS repeat-associated core domain-containing protein n=1 Tax=Paenibacillus chitinolyticus TaxID=79263 RepID=UPI0036715524
MAKKILSQIMIIVITISTLFPYYASAAVSAGNVQAKGQGAAVGQQVLTVSWLRDRFGVTEDFLMAELNKGYQLTEIYKALQMQQETGRAYADIINELNPAVKQRLDELNYESRPIEDTVTSDTYSVTDATYQELPTVTTDTYGLRLMATGKLPTTYDKIAVQREGMKADQAPYLVSSGSADVSTLTGALQLQANDFTLPGRNGLSFPLRRIYDSSSALYYKSEPFYTAFYQVNYYPELLAVVEKIEGNQIDYLYEFTFDKVANFQYRGDTTTWYSPFVQKDKIEYGQDEERKILQLQFPKRNKDTDEPIHTYHFELNGAPFRAKLFPTGRINNAYDEIPVYLNEGYYNKPSDKPLEPLGEGWRWDLPFIETKGDKRYMHIPGGASYEINDDKTLKGYPWKDLTLTRDISVIVGSKVSEDVLTTLDGISYYFSGGKLIQISDRYKNSTQFEYTYVDPYGQVLTKVRDAAANEINISYSSSEVIVHYGDRQVKLIKGKDAKGNKDLLNAVVDPEGRTTRYSYDIRASRFDYVQYKEGENYIALLKQIIHPTGARSVYDYNNFWGYTGPTAAEDVFRATSKEDIVDYVDGTSQKSNASTYIYDGNYRGRYSWDNTFYTLVKNGLTETNFTYKKKYMNDLLPDVFYNTEIGSQAGAEKHVTKQTFDEKRNLPVPIEVTTTAANGGSSSSPVTVKRTYDDYSNVLTETDPLNNTTTNSYDATSHLLVSSLVPVSSDLNAYTEILRNTQGSVTQLTVKENQATGSLKQQVNYGYDGYGNMTTVTVKDTEKDSVITQEFGSQYNGAYVTKQSVNVTNADGEVSTIVQQMEYDKSTGALTKLTDPKGYATTYRYDKLGRITRETGADSSEASVAYDDANNKITLTDVNGEQSIQEFNPLGLKTRATLGKGFATYGYDLFGRTIWSKDAKENQTNYTYDAWGRNIKTNFPDGSSSVTSYDDVGRTKTSTDEENNSIRETYDILGRVIKSEEVKSSGAVELGKVSYDFAGNLASKTDGNGKQSTYKYDLLGRLVAVTDPDMNSTQYTYSLAGNLTELRYADGSVQRKKYDEIGRQIQKIQPQGQTETTYYDLNSNLIKKVDPKGIVREYEYNNRNWLIKDQTPEESISYTYDKAGKRKSLVDATGTTSYQYSPKGELVSIQYPDAYKIDYAYDVQGQRTDAVSDVGQTYTYNERNRIVGLQIKDKTSGNETIAGTVQYQYKKNGFLEQSNLSNGLQTVYTYDGFNMTGLQNQKQSATLGAYGYKYDTNRNITEKTELGSTSTFSYDALNRVKTSSQFNETYEYDNRGNRASLMTDRELSESGSTYTYDDRDRLKKVVTADGKEVSYRYNGDGLLYERTENGKTVRYYYDDSQHLIREAEVGTDGTITPVYQYIYSPAGSILARKPMTANTGLEYYTLNGHGDVVALRDSNGNVLNEYTYDIWGNPVTEKETVPNHFRYSGEYWDNTTKLQYLRARWYDPNLGRFINEDTYEGQLDNPLSLNLYTYVSNNPLTRIDPSGHSFINLDMSNERMQSLIVEARISAKNNGNRRWEIRSSLGSIYKGILGDKNNNQFIFLFDVATMQSPYQELNNLDDAVWAGEELIGIWDGYKRGLARDLLLTFASRGVAKNLKFVTNWKSTKQFGHTFLTHGQGAKVTRSLKDRARTEGDQGQWLNNEKAADFLHSLGEITEVKEIDLPAGLGQVITRTGDIVSSNKVRVVPSPKGGIKTAYPIR